VTEPSTHDSFLELLRNVSVLRVVFLHLVLRPTLIYLPWVQWIYPGMPEIFFVAGVLAVKSLQRRPARQVIADRLRRVLLPYAVFVPVALGAMFVTDYRSKSVGASLSWQGVASFLFPLVTPTGSTNRVVLWSHLWFVTVFLWLILLTPWLMKLVQRIGAFTLLVPLVVFAASITWQKLGGEASQQWARSEVLNTSQFGTFYVLGLLGGAGKLAWLTPGQFRSVRPWIAVATVLAMLGTLTALVIEPISRHRPAELYTSKSAYLFIGGAWLALALAFHRQLSTWMQHHSTRLKYWLQRCTQRTFTLYLWGLPASAIGSSAAKPLLPNRLVAVPVYVGVSLISLAVAVLVVGWVEDVGARRAPRLFPTASLRNQAAPLNRP
jgi:hypothetical protein